MRPILISAPIILLILFLSGCWHTTPTPRPPADGFGIQNQAASTTASINSSTSTTETIYWNEPEPKEGIDIAELMNTSTWKVYENKKFGFSFRYPRTARVYDVYFSDNYQKCINELRGGNDLVPYDIFSSGNEFFLKEKYVFNIDETGKCVEVNNSFDKLKQRHKNRGGWHIYVIPAPDEEVLLNILRDRYGTSCSIGGTFETVHKGTFSIAVKSDGKDLGDTECPLNYISYVKYSPAKRLVAYWDIGQECNITVTSYDYKDCLDHKIADSFKFLD